jgi:DNA-binding transcriptional ArsR family regulator
LDRVFFALADTTRRDILRRLKQEPLQVSSIAEAYAVSMQAVSRHIQVLVRAGFVRQERSGRISACSLDAGPLYEAAVWINDYSHCWQAQFDALKNWLEQGRGQARSRQARSLGETRTQATEDAACNMT